MTDQDQRRDLSKLRTVPLDDATHRRLRLYVHGLREDGDAGVALARDAAEAVNAWIDRAEHEAEQGATYTVNVAEVVADAYARWRGGR